MGLGLGLEGLLAARRDGVDVVGLRAVLQPALLLVHLVLHVLLGAQVLRKPEMQNANLGAQVLRKPEMQRSRETAEVVKVAEADAGGTEGLQQRLTEGQVLREPSGHGCSDGVCGVDAC